MVDEPVVQSRSGRTGRLSPVSFSLDWWFAYLFGGHSRLVDAFSHLRPDPVESFLVRGYRPLAQHRLVSQPTVVDRIQRLQRIETVVYTMDKLVTGADKENPIFPDFLAGDKLLLMVHGEVVAGIDFSHLKPGDVRVDGKAVQLHLPPPQIFSTRLDSARTRVYSRQTGLLVPTDPNLETQVRQEAERQLQEAAMADGILRNAQVNAGSTITSLLQGLGFEKISFD